MKKKTTILCLIIMVVGFTGNVRGQDITPDDIWINEFHYDNAGADSGEFVEVVVKNADSYSLSDITLRLFNGNNGTSYITNSLNTFDEGETIGDYTFFYKEISGIQNGAPDGFALDYNDTLIQFLSYEGTFDGTEGPADGVTSTEVDVIEDSSPDGTSLQLTGAGYGYDEFLWTGPTTKSPGSLNNGQSFFPTIQFPISDATVNESDGTISLDVEILNPDGEAVDLDISFVQYNSTAEASDFSSVTLKTISFSSEAITGDKETATFSLENDPDYEGTETAEFILTNLSTASTAQISGRTTFNLTIEDDDTPNVVINEILADPGGEDPDGNDNYSSDDDEFVELLNNEDVQVVIDGWSISDKTSSRYTFAEGTILPPKGAAVVFGGDSFVGAFGGAIVKGAGSLGLNNGEDEVILKDKEGIIIDSVSYNSVSSGVSVVRNPEATDEFVDHDKVYGSTSNFSPGTKTDGSLFTTSIVIDGNAGWRMLSAPVENLPISELTDDTPIQGFGDKYNKSFYTGYDGTNFTAPADLEGKLNSGEGFILYFFNNSKAGSSTLPVILDVGSTSEPTSDVTVNLHANGDGWNLLGNPYQTAFDVTSLTASGGDLANKIGQIWSDESESYILTSTNNDKVAPGQGFFIQNDISEGGKPAESVTLPISGKTSGTRFYKSSHNKAFVQLELISEEANGEGEQQDLSAVLYFHDESSHGWDSWDAAKLYPLKASYSILNILSEEDIKVKAQDSRTFKNLGDEVFHLDVESLNVKSRQILNWNRSKNIPEAWKFIFTDNKTGEEIIMDESFSYTFNHAQDIQTKTKDGLDLRKVQTVDSDSITARFSITLEKGKSTSTEPIGSTPKKFSLEQNYPNPFNPTTTITYSVAKSGIVNLEVFNVMGQKVATLIDSRKSAGTYHTTWNAADVANGIYYYRLRSAGQTITRQMTLIK